MDNPLTSLPAQALTGGALTALIPKVLPRAVPTECSMSLPVPVAPIEGLTEKQAAFVAHYVASGGKKKQSAIDAGYAAESAHVEAHRLLQMDKVINAVAIASVRAMGSHVPGAVRRIGRLSQTAKSEYIQLLAAQDVLNRTGLTAPKQVNVTGSFSVEIDLS